MSAKRILALTIAALVGSAVLATSAVAAPVKPTDYDRAPTGSTCQKSVKQKRVAVFYVYPTAYARCSRRADLLPRQ